MLRTDGACPHHDAPERRKFGRNRTALIDIVRMSKAILANLLSGFHHMTSGFHKEKGLSMTAAAQYRRNASECVAITAFFVDPQQRAAVLALAESWNRLAAQAEKNEQVVLSTTEAPPQSSEDGPDRSRDGQPSTEVCGDFDARG
jgi:hypothetical protein